MTILEQIIRHRYTRSVRGLDLYSLISTELDRECASKLENVSIDDWIRFMAVLETMMEEDVGQDDYRRIHDLSQVTVVINWNSGFDPSLADELPCQSGNPLFPHQVAELLDRFRDYGEDADREVDVADIIEELIINGHGLSVNSLWNHSDSRSVPRSEWTKFVRVLATMIDTDEPNKEILQLMKDVIDSRSKRMLLLVNYDESGVVSDDLNKSLLPETVANMLSLLKSDQDDFVSASDDEMTLGYGIVAHWSSIPNCVTYLDFIDASTFSQLTLSDYQELLKALEILVSDYKGASNRDFFKLLSFHGVIKLVVQRMRADSNRSFRYVALTACDVPDEVGLNRDQWSAVLRQLKKKKNFVSRCVIM